MLRKPHQGLSLGRTHPSLWLASETVCWLCPDPKSCFCSVFNANSAEELVSGTGCRSLDFLSIS